MKLVKRILSTAAVGAALFAGAQADAATFAFSYTGVGVTASGTLTTLGAALSPEDVTSITGTRNGQSILGLVPLDTDPNFSYDNQFTIANPHFTSDGLLFDVGGGQTGHINLYFFEGAYTDLYVDDVGTTFETPVSFTVSAVPEAGTMLMMGLGLGAVGLFARRRTGAKADAIAA